MGPHTGTGEAATADFAPFFDRLRGSLVRLAWTLTGDTETASDIVQTAFTDAYRDWERISTVDNPDTWVRRMVINRCSNARRDRYRDQQRVTRANNVARTSPTDPLAESTVEFFDLVRALPDRQREVVALHYLDDLSIDDIADALEISAGTVKTSLHRARHTLARTLTATQTGEEAAR